MANQPMVFDNPWQPTDAPVITPARVMAAMPQDAGPAPAPMKIGMGGAPPVFDTPQMPKTRLPSPIEEQEAEASRRLKAYQSKDANPFGSANNHPGVVGKILHGLSMAGNIAGDIFAPSTMALIPGTDLNRRVQEGSLGQRLQSLAQEQSQNEARDAGTDKTNVETQEAPEKAADAHNESSALTDEANAKAAALNNPVETLAQLHAKAVQAAITAGRDPGQDPIVKNYEDAIIRLQPAQNKPDTGEHVSIVGPDGKPMIGTYHPDTGKTTDAAGKEIPNPQPYEKPTVNVNEGHKEELAQKQQIFKTYQPVMDSAERMNVMTKNYEDAMKNHNQQAMLSLLYNHMGMTMGLQKGARMTQDLIREAQQSQPWLQGMQAKFDKDGYLSGVTLSPNQMRDMVSLARDRYKEDTGKARNEAGYLGATDDGPARTPNAATINFYIQQANGDAAEAKKLAADDGWTVK